MLTRRLRLRRETLTALTTEEMVAVAAAGPGEPQPTPPVWFTLGPQGCVTTTLDSQADCITHGTTCAC